MAVSNPTEAVLGILMLMDDVHAKMEGTSLGALPWRPTSPETADELAALVCEPLKRCSDVSEALVVVAVAAMSLAASKTAAR